MATCPLCLFSSPPGADVCGRCGRFRFPSAADQPAVPDSLVSAPDAPASVSAEAAAWDSQPASRLQAAADGELTGRTVRGLLTVPTRTDADPDAAAPATVAATALATPTSGPQTPLPPPAPRLVVIRGVRIGAEYPLYEGKNYIGRSADKPVDIDLNGQEAAEQVWASRQHAVITCDQGAMLIEDLNSLNGTFVNRSRIHPGQLRPLQPNDVVQVGTVQFRLVM